MAADTDHEFAVTTTAVGPTAVVVVRGQADLHTAPELRTEIGAAIDAGSRGVVVDLTEATFIDSMTLGVLLGTLKRLATMDGRLSIVCPDSHLRRVFEITSLDRVLDLRDTPAEALEHVRRSEEPGT